jgi:superfamily II DNA or RNA helicase
MRLHKYQLESRDFLLERLSRHSGAGLWLEPGLGKTITTLDTILALHQLGQVERTLVVAPARVIATSWPKEIENWGIPLRWGWLKGDEEERMDVVASNPHIYFVGCENLALRTLSEETKAKRKSSQMAEWLLKKGFKADLLVVDEVTKFKSWSASRSKVLRKLIKSIPKRITLTGTPTPNGLGDIFAQQYLLDSGETLSPYITHFRNRFMRACGFENRQYEMRPEMVDTLQKLLAPWYMSGTAQEHLDMPELVHNVIDVELPPKAAKVYKGMQKEMFAEINDIGLTAITSGSKYGMCRQIASGNAYDEDGQAVAIHDAKLDALEDLYEELNGKSLLVAYWYNHEYERIQARFPHAAVIRGGVSAAKTKSIIDDWQKGKIKMLVGQASAISHGVDGLQKGGNDLCWYTLTDQPEVKTQLERRIFRQGVHGNQVRIHYLLAKSTVDGTIHKTLEKNEATQADVMRAIKELSR